MNLATIAFELKGRLVKICLFSLLILANLVVRIPSIPHEKGYDSFFIHTLANFVSNFGTAGWWMSWMSIFGLYPYSYASSVPFTLSGMSQLTGIRMETTILYFCIILGLFSIFTSYVFASIFFKDFTSKFLFATLFSLSAGTLGLTTWEITTRAQFLVLFPFFLYLLFKSITINLRFLLLYLMAGILLFATHHYFYFALFFSTVITSVFIVAYLKRSILQDMIGKIPGRSINYFYVAALFLIFMVPFFSVGHINLITAGSRYSWMIDILMITVRNLGFVFPIAVAGIIYMSFKENKSVYEWSMLVCLIPTLVFSYDKTYGYLFTYLFMIYFGSIGAINILKNIHKNPRFFGSALVIILLLNVSFSGFFAHSRTGVGGGNAEWYMQETTFQAGEWIFLNMPSDKIAISNGNEGARMFASYGGLPIIYLDDVNNYINGLISVDENTFKRNKILSKDFYFDNPYVIGTSTSSGLLNWISTFPITDKRVIGFLDSNNISYFFRDSYRSDVLFNSLNQNKATIFNNGRMEIWLN